MNFQEFLQGKAFDAYKYFGAHLLKKGAIFRVYAPNAAKVELQGDFSGWELLEMKRKLFGCLFICGQYACPGDMQLYMWGNRR